MAKKSQACRLGSVRISYNRTIDKVSGYAMGGGGLLELFGMLSGNKTLLKTGLSVMATGAAGKGLSRMAYD
jgi:hypothetical protein